jgi:hypothetical protein
MPNGKPGDHPVTDVIDYERDVFGAEIDELIREVAAVAQMRAFGDLTQLIFDAEVTPTLRPQLRRELQALLSRLEAAGR